MEDLVKESATGWTQNPSSDVAAENPIGGLGERISRGSVPAVPPDMGTSSQPTHATQ